MGKIQLDHTGAGAGITLSSDGTDLLLDGTAIGGGGGTALELYAENPVTPTAPSATGANAVAIGDGSNASSTGAIALGYDAVSSGLYAQSFGRNATATAVYSTAIGTNTDATSSYSTALGQNSTSAGSQAVTGLGAMALGGSYASGTDSFAAAIANNTASFGATGANSVAIGDRAKATGQYSSSLSSQAQATNFASIAIGFGAQASGSVSMAIGGNCIASGQYAVAIGNTTRASAKSSFASGFQAKADIEGKYARASRDFASTQGTAQYGHFVLCSDTTDATPEALTTNNSTASTNNQVILPNNSAYAFHGTIVARQQASQGTACAAFKIEGLIRREGSAGTTVLVNSATTVLDNTPAWGMTLSADTVNGGLKIEVTGAAATNIRWVATCHTSEVTF